MARGSCSVQYDTLPIQDGYTTHSERVHFNFAKRHGSRNLNEYNLTEYNSTEYNLNEYNLNEYNLNEYKIIFTIFTSTRIKLKLSTKKINYFLYIIYYVWKCNIKTNKGKKCQIYID